MASFIGRTKRIEGWADTHPFRSTLVAPADIDVSDIGGWVRKSFWAGVTGSQFVIRPNLNHPEDCFQVGPSGVLRVGDWVVADTQGDDVKEIISINGLSVRQARERPYWPDDSDSMPVQSILDSSFRTKLRLLHCDIGNGDIVVVTTTRGTGKSWFVKDVVNNLTEGMTPLLLLIGEREKEIRRLSGFPFIFAAPSTRDGQRKLRVMEIGLHAAMRKGELGEEVVVGFDSATRMIDALTFIPTRKGLGLRIGGVNPLALDLIQVVMGVARKPDIEGMGSITMVITILNRGSGDGEIINQAESTSTVQVTLSPNARVAKVYPPLMITPREIRAGGETLLSVSTESRFQDEYDSLASAATELSALLVNRSKQGDPVVVLKDYYRQVERLGSPEAVLRHYGIQVPIHTDGSEEPRVTPPSDVTDEEVAAPEEVHTDGSEEPRVTLPPDVTDEEVAQALENVGWAQEEQEVVA